MAGEDRCRSGLQSVSLPRLTIVTVLALLVLLPFACRGASAVHDRICPDNGTDDCGSFSQRSHDPAQCGSRNRSNCNDHRSTSTVASLDGLVAATHTTASTDDAVTVLTVGQQWLAAMVANLIVTLFALTGALAMPFLRKKRDVGGTIITFALSLAVGSLLGDAILHLIPEAFGVFSHNHGHSHEAEEIAGADDQFRHLWTSCVTVIGTYSFFVIEKLLHHVMATSAQQDAESSVKTQPGDIKPVAWLFLAGDGLHNFVDGLAIATAFMTSWQGGLQTSLAVLLHEIPHELGDFAVLLSSGFSLWKALFFNCLGNAPAFLGSIVALTVLPNSESAKNYILAFTAGNFLYIALVDLVPSLFASGIHANHGSHDHTHRHDDGHMHGHALSDVHSSTHMAPEKANAGTSVDRDVDVVSLTVEPSTCPTAHMSGEGIFRASTKDNWTTRIAIHLGILTGYGAMFGLALLEATHH